MTKERKEQIEAKANELFAPDPNLSLLGTAGKEEAYTLGRMASAFERGAQFADTHPADLWIDCKVELPPVLPGDDCSIDVIITAGQFGRRTGQLLWEKSYYNFYNQTWAFGISKPTHWMRIVPPSTK